MKARDVSFFKRNAWKGTYSSILTIPVEALADKCFNAWLDIEDTNFAEVTLPDKKLADGSMSLSIPTPNRRNGIDSTVPWIRLFPLCRWMNWRPSSWS